MKHYDTIKFQLTTHSGVDICLKVDVHAQVYGQYYPGSREQPPEYPEVEWDFKDEALLLTKDGRWMPYNLRKLPEDLYSQVEEQAEEYAEEHLNRDDGDDYDPGDPDDYDDPRSYNVDCSTDSWGRNILP